jgi:type IV pilus assembly protein PilY1
MPAQVGSGGQLYQASYTLTPIAGHLSAYSFSNSGFVASTKLWDAAMLMTTPNRTSKLLSNTGTGTIIAFNALDAAAFAASATPTVAEIINYTITPSYSNGVYLAGRASGSLMGMFGDQSMMPLLLTPPANVLLDTDPNFVTYKTSQTTRKSSVLVQNDDGFLYDFSSADGSLLWGWMPRELVSGLKNYTNFWSSGNMKGGATIADSPTTGASYATFILGTAQGGALHYALALKNDTSSPPNAYPDTVAWTNSVPGAISPAAQAPVITYINTAGVNAGYANYITTAGAISTLYVHKIAAGATASSAALPFTPSSELVVDNGYFYVADTTGVVWKMPVNTNAAAVITGKVKIGNTYNNLPATYVGVYRYNNADYVWASSTIGITLFAYNTATTAWRNLWESHVGGAGSWDVTTGLTYTADTSAVTTPTVGKIQMLPTGASITARASIVKDALLVPVLVPDATEPCVAGKAYLFEYAIDTGYKPSAVLYKVNATGSPTVTTDNLEVGLGTAMSAVLSTGILGTIIQASANQTLSGGNGITATYLVSSSTGSNSGLVSWREITN